MALALALASVLILAVRFLLDCRVGRVVAMVIFGRLVIHCGSFPAQCALALPGKEDNRAGRGDWVLLFRGYGVRSSPCQTPALSPLPLSSHAESTLPTKATSHEHILSHTERAAESHEVWGSRPCRSFSPRVPRNFRTCSPRRTCLYWD